MKVKVKKLIKKCDCQEEILWIKRIVDFKGKSELTGRCKRCKKVYKLV